MQGYFIHFSELPVFISTTPKEFLVFQNYPYCYLKKKKIQSTFKWLVWGGEKKSQSWASYPSSGILLQENSINPISYCHLYKPLKLFKDSHSWYSHLSIYQAPPQISWEEKQEKNREEVWEYRWPSEITTDLGPKNLILLIFFGTKSRVLYENRK